MNANKIKTVHTSRTIMYSELQKVMDFGMEADNYTEALENNVTGKKSSSGVNKTANYLKQLYGFDLKNDLFLVYRYFWKIADTKEKPLLAFIYAINNDDLLAESIDVVCKTQVGEKATVESFEDEIEKYHPKPILFKTKFWIVTHNAWPYEFTKNHFLLIYRPAHIEDSSQMNNHAYAEIKEIITKLNREHGLGSGTFLMRFGDMKKTGATVLHLHAQIIEGDSEHPNYDPQKGVITRVG